MTELEKDLSRYYNEAFHRKDIKAGIQLLMEVTGMFAIGSLLISALFVWLPGIGIVIPTVVALRYIALAGQAYVNMNSDERKQVRAVVRWINGGIKLID